MTEDELKAWRKKRKAARRAVVREALALYLQVDCPKDKLHEACRELQTIELQPGDIVEEEQEDG